MLVLYFKLIHENIGLGLTPPTKRRFQLQPCKLEPKYVDVLYALSLTSKYLYLRLYNIHNTHLIFYILINYTEEAVSKMII